MNLGLHCLHICEPGGKSIQGRFNSIIGPGEKRYTEMATYTTTRKNKNVNVD
jgi:hypothetical protein